MMNFYFPFALVVGGGVVYHLAQKSIPKGMNPFLATISAYLIGIVLCAICAVSYPSGKGFVASAKESNWAVLALGFGVAAIEVGFLLAYRAGWRISIATIAANVAVMSRLEQVRGWAAVVLGLVIDAPAVTGGGFLFLDPEKGQYAGDIQLNLDGGITVTAIGLIATHLPNDAKGFSFVVLITAQGFKPIPLGLGFTLTGIGGLLAINRTCNQEFLREGIKSKTLDSLLFPDDPIRNAVQILGTLNNAFPPRDGSFFLVQSCRSAGVLRQY